MKNDYSLMKKLLIWAMANVLYAVSALAATYPVELNVQLIPPYGNCLASHRDWSRSPRRLEKRTRKIPLRMLTGRFVFSESFLKPASGKGGPVVANFSFRYSSGLITKVCFSDSFRVGGLCEILTLRRASPHPSNSIILKKV